MNKIKVSFWVDVGLWKCVGDFAKKNHSDKSKTVDMIVSNFFDDKTKLNDVQRKSRLLYKQRLKKYKAHQFYFKPNLRRKIITHILNNGRMVDIEAIVNIIQLDLETLEDYEPEAKKAILKDLGNIRKWYSATYWELEIDRMHSSKMKLVNYKK